MPNNKTILYILIEQATPLQEKQFEFDILPVAVTNLN